VEEETSSQSADPAISEMLEKSIQDNKLSGFDYLKFVSMVEKMKGKGGLSEESRFQTAFTAAESMGVSKKKLVESGAHYLDVLKQDEEEFNESCEDFAKKEVKSKEAKLSQTEATIATLTKQLEQLTDDRESLQKEVEEGRANLEARKSSFQATVEQFKSAIQSNIEKINQYLQ
jgi:chromosome segregation ATPase